jgi:hypothetical protein
MRDQLEFAAPSGFAILPSILRREPSRIKKRSRSSIGALHKLVTGSSYGDRGGAIGGFEANPTEKGKLLGKWQTRLARVGPGLLILGFSLQLIAAWISRAAS